MLSYGGVLGSSAGAPRVVYFGGAAVCSTAESTIGFGGDGSMKSGRNEVTDIDGFNVCFCESSKSMATVRSTGVSFRARRISNITMTTTAHRMKAATSTAAIVRTWLDPRLLLSELFSSLPSSVSGRSVAGLLEVGEDAAGVLGIDVAVVTSGIAGSECFDVPGWRKPVDPDGGTDD